MNTYQRMGEFIENHVFHGQPVEDVDRHEAALAFICDELETLRGCVVDFGKFKDEWGPLIKLLGERVKSYDERFAEVHHRLDAWNKLSERITKATTQFESLFIKGELK